MKPETIQHSLQSRGTRVLDRGLDLAMRIVPPVALVAVSAFFSAQQAVRPSHRAIKALVLLGLMALMLRFDMVYSVYLFVLLFVFPTGISIGSSNTVIMTIIPMIWAVRATSGKIPLTRRSPLDAAIGVFLLAHVVSLFNVTEGGMLARSVGVIWLQLTACAFFYAIYLFVNDESKLFRLGKLMCVSCFMVMATGVLELFFPGAMIVPGWIGVSQRLGEGVLAQRITGLRVGGAFGSHDMLGDFGSQMVLFMAFFFLRARNPAEKTFWVIAALTTITAVLATANRGAMSGLLLALILGAIFFRRAIGSARLVLLAALGTAGLLVGDHILSEKTVAVSVVDRFANTQFEGIVPENRTMTWKPSLDLGMERPLFGHGPYFDVGIGIEKRYWPHNGYLFYFVTLGLFGAMAFLWIVGLVFRESRTWRARALQRTPLGNFMAITQIWFLVMLWEQLRTDHQRDAIYPYIVWMCFGTIVAAAAIARRKMRSRHASSGRPPAHAVAEPAAGGSGGREP